MQIDDEVVRRLETLAALRLTPEERARLRQQLSRILDYVQQLEALDTDGVPPTSHVLADRQGLRADEVRPSLPRDEMLRNAPDARAGCFRVPRFVGDEEST